MVKRRLLSSSLLAASAFLGCKDTLSSDGGGLAVTAQFSESAANASFNAARIRIIGPTNRTVNTTPGAEEVIEGLAPGSYRVVLEGLEGNEVELYGQQNSVAVTAGNTTDVTVTFSSFIPSLDPPATPSPTVRFDVTFDAVPGAAGYVVEWDTDGSFAAPERIPVTSTTAEVPGVPGDVYVRVRAATEFATFSAPSNAQVVNVAPVVVTVAVTPADLDTLIGAGDTIQYAAETFDANGDEFGGAALTWTTSDGAVAMVDSEGRVIPQANGTTNVIATSGGIQGSGSFTSLTIRPDSGLAFPYTIPVTPISLAWDGSRYLFLNGGIATQGTIKTYDEDGQELDSLPINFDGRSIHYREADGEYYMKEYLFRWFHLDIDNLIITPIDSIFSNSQSSPGLTPDGLEIIERHGDSLRFIEFQTGTRTRVATGLGNLGVPLGTSVATDGHLIYTWAAQSTVAVYDFQGRLVTTFPLGLPNAGGYSLSYANGMLWSTDAGGNTGNWWGFILTPIAPVSGPPVLAGVQTGNLTMDAALPCVSGSTTVCR